MNQGPLVRRWWPDARSRTIYYLVVGLALISAPLWMGVAVDALAGQSVTYHAVDVNPNGDGVTMDGLTGVVREDGIEGIDCYFDANQSYTCLLEQQLLDGSLTVEKVPGGTPNTRYVHHDQFYERHRTNRSGKVILELRPVSASAVLQNVSTPLEEASDPTKTAIETGTGRARPDMENSNEIVRANGSYYLIAPESMPPPREESSVPLGWLSVLVGLLALWRGVVRYRRLTAR